MAAEFTPEALVVRPGDTLVLRYEQTMTAQEAADLKERATRYLPEGSEVLIVCAGIGAEVTRP